MKTMKKAKTLLEFAKEYDFEKKAMPYQDAMIKRLDEDVDKILLFPARVVTKKEAMSFKLKKDEKC